MLSSFFYYVLQKTYFNISKSLFSKTLLANTLMTAFSKSINTFFSITYNTLLIKCFYHFISPITISCLNQIFVLFIFFHQITIFILVVFFVCVKFVNLTNVLIESTLHFQDHNQTGLGCRLSRLIKILLQFYRFE